MYKRRKVFSKIGEKNFSTTEFKTQKEFAEKKKEADKKIRIGSKARIWVDKNLQTKKDREAIIEAYDQKGDRNSHKLGKQAAKYAGATGALLGAGAASLLTKGKEGAAETLKNSGASKKIVEAAKKNPKLAAAAIIAGTAAATGSGAAGAGYVGTRVNRTIGKKVEDHISETAAHNAQKKADENKVAAKKMTKEEFAKKYGKKTMNIKRKNFSKKKNENTGAALGVTGASAVAAGSIKAKKLADKMEKKRAEEGKAIVEKVKAKEKEVTHTIYPNREKAKKAEEELKAVKKEAKAVLKKVKEPKKVEKVLRAIGKPAEKVAKIVLK